MNISCAFRERYKYLMKEFKARNREDMDPVIAYWRRTLGGRKRGHCYVHKATGTTGVLYTAPYSQSSIEKCFNIAVQWTDFISSILSLIRVLCRRPNTNGKSPTT